MARSKRKPRRPDVRVSLAPLLASDRPEFLQVARRSRSLHRPWVWPPTTPAAFESWLADTDPGSRERRLLRHREDGRLLGYLAANQIVLGGLRSAYLGYWAAAGEAGQGFMREGLGLWIRHLLTRRDRRLHRLEANIQPDNRASIRLARACGLRKEGFSPRYLRVGGRWCDHERWAITVEDWRLDQQQ